MHDFDLCVLSQVREPCGFWHKGITAAFADVLKAASLLCLLMLQQQSCQAFTCMYCAAKEGRRPVGLQDSHVLQASSLSWTSLSLAPCMHSASDWLRNKSACNGGGIQFVKVVAPTCHLAVESPMQATWCFFCCSHSGCLLRMSFTATTVLTTLWQMPAIDMAAAW